MEICFATNNQHKVEEVAKAAGPDFKIVTLKELSVFEELPETQNTLEGNAIQKALYLFERLAIPCFADDSGLEVAALDGKPGVYSARYAGPERDDKKNIDLLLKNLADKSNRNARFRTVIALAGFGPVKLFEGSVEGIITTSRRGKEGFGYDPVFVPHGFDETFAQMSLEEKNSLSHRGSAVKQLTTFLKASILQ